MSEVSFELSRQADDAASGFDLGDIQVTGDQASASWVGQTPSQSMMIYVALAERHADRADNAGHMHG